MKILLISGFLGAGKTTFIQALTRRSGREFAIFENELAGDGVDRGRLMAEGSAVNIWEMTEGCICCEARGDFRASILTIANSVDPEVLLIEPTGVGMPANILASLQSLEYERIALLAPITVVDALHFRESQRMYPDLFARQVEAAQRLILSKTETLSPEDRAEIAGELKRFNPGAEILSQPYEEQPQRWWDSLVERYLDGSVEAPRSNDKMPDTFSLRDVRVESPERLICFLEDMVREKYGRIIRSKGCVTAGGQRFRFDSVNGQYLLTGAGEAEERKAVFIGSRLRRQNIRSVMLGNSEKIRIRRFRSAGSSF